MNEYDFICTFVGMFIFVPGMVCLFDSETRTERAVGYVISSVGVLFLFPPLAKLWIAVVLGV